MYRYDVFISYARVELAWVTTALYEPLQRCRTADGSVPRVFLDVGPDGLQVGHNWMEELANAIEASRKVILVFSKPYFASKMCQWEMKLAHSRDPTNAANTLLPILKDPGTEVDWLAGKLIQQLSSDAPGWFPQLCVALGVEPVEERVSLRFRDGPPESVQVNNTLAPIRVEVAPPQRSRGVEVTLAAPGGVLRGSLTVVANDGIAEFSDLSMAEASARPLTLVASAAGCDPATSGAFRVVPPPSPRMPDGGGDSVLVPAVGEAVFFDDGRSLAVIAPDRVSVFTSEGARAGDGHRLKSPLRWIVRRKQWLVLADWTGRVVILDQQGAAAEWEFGSTDGGLAVPGGGAIADDRVVVGFWNGDVYRLRPGTRKEKVFTHPRGVQGLAVAAGAIAAVDHSGSLVLRAEDGSVREVPTGERLVHAVLARGDGVIVVGARHLLTRRVAGGDLLRESTGIGETDAVLGHVECPVVCDAQGRGIRFDSGLSVVCRFHVPAGAAPTSADDPGDWTAFRQSDGNRLLMHRQKVVHTHRGGTLAVSPDGEWFALGERRGVRILGRDALLRLVASEPRA